ncbi:hypothetical protein WJX73_000624 [Symbiochloris irregularis]|uniref:Protein kinase domain-containing protein n=1 Tax=Symbiochloris irregularis TaxID=706552 RepID=A0AAW1P6E7_9CHLO
MAQALSKDSVALSAPTPPEEIPTRPLDLQGEADASSSRYTTQHRLLQPASTAGGDEAQLRSLVDTDEDLVSLLEKLQDHHWRLNSADVQICLKSDGSDDLLSEGSSGKVYRGILNNSLVVAIKTLREQSPPSRIAFVEEIVCLMNLRHANIVSFYGAIMEGQTLMLITELAPRGSLFDVLANDRERRLAWDQRGRRIALDVARGVSYMHSKGALHQDLKSKNVLLTRDWQAKLCDMGLCGLARGKRGGEPGTLEYTAPEVLCGDGSPSTPSADIYSLGIIIWEIVTGRLPDDRCFDVRVPDDCSCRPAARQRTFAPAAATTGSGRTVKIGFPSVQDSYLEAEEASLPGLDEQWRLGDDDLNDEDVYGPPVCMLAGFPPEEFGLVRDTVDRAGGHAVRVVPCTGPMLHSKIEVALEAPEPAWDQPRPESWGMPGAFSTHRAVLFSGMSLSAQAAVVELLEDAGMPSLCLATASPENAHRKVGEVLAEAVKEQRGHRALRATPDLDYRHMFAPPDTRQAVERAASYGIEEMIERMQRGEGGDPEEPLAGSNAINSANPYKSNRGTQKNGTASSWASSSRASDPADAASFQAPAAAEDEDDFNLLDAAAQGQDIASRLFSPTPQEPGLKPGTADGGLNGKGGVGGASTVAEESSPSAALNADDQALLDTMKSNAQKLPPSQQEKLAMELEMMKDEKGQYERIIKELTNKFNDHPHQSQPALQNKLKQEAWEPTQDAIKAALSCGISGDEIRKMITDLEADSASWATSWSRLPDLSKKAWDESELPDDA